MGECRSYKAKTKVRFLYPLPNEGDYYVENTENIKT